MFRWSFSPNLDSTPAHFAILIMRLGIAALMWTHGLPKLNMIITGNFHFFDPVEIGPVASLILATFAEIICPVFICVGLATRFATIPVIIEMSVAAFVQHANAPIGIREKALLYLLVFLVLLFTGAGKYSFDNRLSSRKFRR